MLTRKVPYNTVIIEQGNETDALYFVKSGEVRVVRRMSPDLVLYLTLFGVNSVLASFEANSKRSNSLSTCCTNSVLG